MRIEFSCSRMFPSVFVIVSKAAAAFVSASVNVAAAVAAAASSVTTHHEPHTGGWLSRSRAHAVIFAIFSNISNWKIFDLTFWQ